MCYSALIRADYATLVREFGAILSLEEFAELYAHDPGKKRPKTPRPWTTVLPARAPSRAVTS